MATVQQVLDIARKELGTHEHPPGTNRVKYCDWYGVVGPWCAMYLSWVFHQAGMSLPASTSKGFAYTPAGAAWFRKQNRWTQQPRPGDVVFFDFPSDGVNRISHVGLVEEVRADGSILAIEGN
ncbi:MAG: CHAP domain-containing protein, partial [Actinomycetota bacterium]|nr:CHAP domain-containing protein [Actinomycetota bacterium]